MTMCVDRTWRRSGARTCEWCPLGGEPATTIAAAVTGRDVVVKAPALQPLRRLRSITQQREPQSPIGRRLTTIQHRIQDSEPGKGQSLAVGRTDFSDQAHQIDV